MRFKEIHKASEGSRRPQKASEGLRRLRNKGFGGAEEALELENLKKPLSARWTAIYILLCNLYNLVYLNFEADNYWWIVVVIGVIMIISRG